MGRSLWLRGENTDPGAERVVGRSSGHVNPTSRLCLLRLSVYRDIPSHAAPHKGFTKGLSGVSAPEIRVAPTVGTYGPSELVSLAPFTTNAEKWVSSEACLFWPRGERLN